MRGKLRALAGAVAVGVLMLAFEPGSIHADGSHFTITWVAADPTTYDHSTGVGGTFDAFVNSLEGSDFTCGDIVVFFASFAVDASETDEHTIELDLGFLGQPTGQDGVGFASIVSASANPGDANHVTDGDEVVS